MTEERTKRILWLSPMCILDRRGGAACQMRSVLSTLSEAGWEAYALQMTLFDGKDQYPVNTIVGNEYAGRAYHGKTLKFNHNGIQHHLFRTRSTYGGDLQIDEARAFYQSASKAIHAIQPDVVVTYGSSALSKALYREARKVARTMIFYLANASYEDPTLFEPFDQVLVNSEFTRDYYRKKIGIATDVLRTLMPQEHVPDPGKVLATRAPSERGRGFITFVNPSLVKGATLFARLVKMAERERPDWTFLAVEGRLTDDQWREAGVDLANQPNVFWIPNQQDMRRVYERTSILLFPSFCVEAAGRVGAEAQLGGIPVLGANHGGIPELLNGGGFTFDIPERCRESFKAIPSEEEVRPWFEKIAELMDDEQAFIEARDRALECGAWLSPDWVRKDIIDRFERYAEGEGLTPPMTRETRQARTVVKGDESGRNDPCPCGSGKKHKKCCLDRASSRSAGDASGPSSVSNHLVAQASSNPSDREGSGASSALPSQVRRVRVQERGREPLHVEIPEAEVFRIHNIFRHHEYALPDEYEPPETMTVVDVGANGGLFALYAQRWAERVTVHSFEPNPQVWELLQHNIASQRDIYTHAFALDEVDGTATLYQHPRNTRQTSMVQSWVGGAQSVSVRRRHAGAALEELGIDHIDVLKIDTEGAEPAILRGLAAYLPVTSVVMLEYHSSADRTWIEQRLQSDFVCTSDTPQQPGSSVGTMKWLRRHDW